MATARTLMTIGTLALYSAADLPQTLVLDRQTSGGPQTLSDSTRVWQGSGIVAVDFTVDVLLYTTDEGGTPQNKLDALTFMQDSRQRYPFSWQNLHFPVEVVGIKQTHQGSYGDIAVTISLFRPAAGPLVATTQPTPGTTASRSMDRIAALSAYVGPLTQAQITAMQTARAVAGF